ncbi:MAG: AmmeMemoRadiSam system protein B [Candidatus Sumerlaeia bacterium]
MAQSLTRGVREPAQAGRFYDEDAGQLRSRVRELIGPAAPAEGGAPRFLVSPHAGYIYSGRVAGAAYRQVAGRPIDRVAVLGPSHYEEFEGGALASAVTWRTPLGDVPVDAEAAQALLAEPGYALNDAAHGPEHSVEVQLPFLQVALGGGFSIVPILFGRPPAAGLEEAAAGLRRVVEGWGRQGLTWLVVASSDTYHGYDGDSCRENDRRLRGLFEAFDPAALQGAFHRREVMACGWVPIMVAMLVARAMEARPARAIDRADSREATGESGGYVVGYFAGAIG